MSQINQLELIWQEVLEIMASELAKPSFDADQRQPASPF